MDQSLSLLIFPNEILELIINKLSTMDKRRLRLTCNRMEAQVMRYFQLYPILNDGTVDVVLGIRWPFSKLLVHNLSTPSDHFVQGLSRMAEYITQLTFHHAGMNRVPPTSLLNCTRIIQICSNVTELRFARNILNILPIGLNFFNSISLELTKLKKLELGFAGIGSRGSVLAALTYSRFPLLESFVVCIKSWNQGKLRRLEYSKITEFIAMHWSTLKVLKIYDKGNSYLTSHDVDDPVELELTTSEILDLLGKVQLKSFEWINSSIIPPWTAAPNLINGQRQLKTLVFGFPVDHLMYSVRMAITGSCHTLETFKIELCPMYAEGFDCRMLSECQQLRNIYLSHPNTAINMDQLPKSISDLHWNSPIGQREVKIIKQNLVNLTSLRLRGR